MIIQDESQKLVAGGNYVISETIEPFALFTPRNTGHKSRKSYPVECDFFHMKGHTKDTCFKLVKCEFCNQKGHLKENCYKIIGYPLDFQVKEEGNGS